MFSWLPFVAPAAVTRNVLEEHNNEKTMIHSKADAIVKATSVNVLTGDLPPASIRRDYELTDATVALSTELQKKLPEPKYMPFDSASARFSDIKRQSTISVSRRSSMMFPRIAHSSKSSAAILSTNISVNGSVVLDNEFASPDESFIRSSSLSVIERLTRQTSNTPDDEEPTKSQEPSRFPIIENRAHTASSNTQSTVDEKQASSMGTEADPNGPRHAQPSKSYWELLFGPPNHVQTLKEETMRKDTKSDNSSSVTKPVKKQTNDTVTAYTALHQNSEQPKTSYQQLPPKAASTNYITHKSSNTSLSSRAKIPKKPNMVIPTFHSQFQPPREIPVASTPAVYFNKTLDIIHSILIPAKPESDIIGPLWWKRRMRTRFSTFIDEMKMPEGMAGKKIVIVGVHGWFPMKLVRSVIGEPTGTSPRFCEQMVAALKQYFEHEHGIVLPDDLITCVPLQGEGKVEDRVNKLYNNLLDNSSWLESVSSADIIFWATHSQGTPVSVMLLRRLLERGHVHLFRQSVCLLAMAGIACGPFPALKRNLIVKYFEADAARELFEFMDSNSDISQKFRDSLAYILSRGVKTVLAGSMQDQVVPLYSALMSGISHPNILRSVYVDGDIYSEDDFIINLVSFALRLKNAGLSDHSLLIYLSDVLAGNLYSLEGGHSTIYEEIEVYASAIRFLFETKPFGSLQQIRTYNDSEDEQDIDDDVEVQMEPFQAKLQFNPFYLPWAMRGICDDTQILKDNNLYEQLCRLRDMFQRWNPSTTKMRELKFRLEPLKLTL
ncbi:hypothetical protein EC973_008842 [Apophysomyces ossiformis]|uniref:YMC020W-like alpha/beta hydrolase domain-containing protein n=1 Tax=Apophysomyces ossiformis TaxID=679940 RepID=A0A8H7BYQ3_9FUNG|nr:hypothetical protein EC973_008842 [Apophysomyces ossiformis]